MFGFLAFVYRNLCIFLCNVDRADAAKFIALCFVGIVVAFFEVVSIAVLLPILDMLFSDDGVYIRYLTEVFGSFHKGDRRALFVSAVALFIVFTLLAAVTKVLHLYLTNLMGYSLGGKLAVKVYHRILSSDFLTFQRLAKSDILSTLVYRSYSITSGFIIPVSAGCASFSLLLGMAILAFITLPSSALLIAVFAVGVYVTVAIKIAKTIDGLSKQINEGAGRTINEVNEGIGNIKSIILGDLQDMYTSKYQREETLYRTAKFVSQMYTSIPRPLIEALVLVLAALLLLYLVDIGIVVEEMVPVLALMAVTFQKSLPHIQAVFSNINIIRSEADSVGELSSFLIDDNSAFEPHQPLLVGTAVAVPDLQADVRMRDVIFTFSEQPAWQLEIGDLTLKKGGKYAVTGASGSGKTTLVDLLIGMYQPHSGEILVDEVLLGPSNIVGWRHQIAYVPQDIYLSGGSALEMISALSPGDKINWTWLEEAVRFAALDFVLEDGKLSEQKLNADLGEDGKRLSGGQRVRMAIARAVYQRKRFLVLDEATASLDEENAQRIINNLLEMDRDYTVIFVTHTHLSLTRFDGVVKVKNGIACLSKAP